MASATIRSEKGDFESMDNLSIVRAVAAGDDCFGEMHQIGDHFVRFKVGTGETGGNLFVAENVFPAKGGPGRHVHPHQDEWFYVLEGEFIFEIGDQRFTLRDGDSALGPRQVPHVWAFTGGGTGRLLVSFAPAGRIEAFFREITSATSRPLHDSALWSDHEMELLGPPLVV